jgi:hypothetical protein
VMDLGQGKPFAVSLLKPLMRATLALQSGDAAGAARAILPIIAVPENGSAQEIQAAIEKSLSNGTSGSGVIERLLAGLMEAEKKGALVKPEYAPLEKAFLIYTGYSEYTPKDHLLKSLERGMALRMIREGVSPWKIMRLWLKRVFHGPPAVRAEMESLIEGLGGAPKSDPVRPNP